MTCNQVCDLISWYVDGDLSPAKAIAVREHIAGCAACRAELAAEQASAKALESPIMVFDAPEILAQIKNRAIEPRKQSVRPRWQWAFAGLAAACCLVWFGLSITDRDASPSKAAANLTAPQTQPATPIAETPVPTRPRTESITSPDKPQSVIPETRKTHHPRRKPIVAKAPATHTAERSAPSRITERPAPKIEYLVVYNHPGLGDGIDAAEASGAGGDSDAPAASSYSISMTDESTGVVTNVSVYATSDDGESGERATVRFRSGNNSPTRDERERSSTDEKPLDIADSADSSDLC